ncbi:ABC transporter permease [Alkalihalobacillus pseudalcaliphilus]|uniref:ABC transporter permease n=1 Tax=Alkalihalobacillus pseudalcaliphilus TaxID=79884 RepID=UPI00064D9206|nr:ABC transporter permease [Alkalihalobacillus pseudalcaliphilus]KMK74980.1 peptide ABC transporter [Alkalihalobacillus pseudalcaliphilus]
MASYIVKRLFSLFPVLFVVSIVIFSIIHITPGNPAAMILGQEATQEAIDALSQQMGLHLPVYEQYLNWVMGVFQADLGNSFFMREPVLDLIFNYIQPTLSLSIFAQVIAIMIAIPVGIIAATKRGSWLDQSLMSMTLVGMAIPSFLLGLLLMLVLGVQLQWLPIGGYRPLEQGLFEHLKFLLMPALSLATVQAALIARMTRSSMLEVLNRSFIKTARSKGSKERRVIFGHALRNAFLPVLTVIGQSFGTLLAGAVVTEIIFNIPGIGQLVVNSVERRDYPVIQGTVLFITVSYVFINLLIDLLYGIIDPRVRLGQGKRGG